MMLPQSLAALVGLLLSTGMPASAQIQYDVSFPNAAHHEARITLTLQDLPPGPVALRMSRSSPGRYALHEFAKNVYDLRVTDGAGAPLTATRPDPYQWDVTDHDGTVRVSYTLYADHGDGTYAQIDRTHAHLNMPAVFLWARGLDDRPIRVTFHPPAGSGWRVATQLVPSTEPLSFTAPNQQYFMDSPTELSAFTLRQWTVSSRGRVDTIRLAVHHTGSDADVDQYADAVRAVVDAELALFGGTPPFDYGTYTFIADYLPWVDGDGMEHRNSTILSSARSLADAAQLIGTVSHEFFHAWNVERLRPRSLEPFDFERANMSDALWFAEGFTSYYTPVFLRRAGLITVAAYAAGLADGINAVRLSPGRRQFTPMEMSMQAPFADAATAVDATNEENTFVSYYTWGSVLGLALDLRLRALDDDQSLDGFLRLLWDRFGRPAIPYTVDDLEHALGAYAGPAFARDFFTRHIRGSELPDFAALLAQAGFLVRAASPGRAFLGLVNLDYAPDGARVVSNTREGSPLYDVGIARGDLILEIGDVALRGDDDWQRVNDRYRPGQEVAVVFESRDGRHTATMRIQDDPRIEVVMYEAAGRTPSAAMLALRESWLGARR